MCVCLFFLRNCLLLFCSFIFIYLCFAFLLDLIVVVVVMIIAIVVVVYIIYRRCCCCFHVCFLFVAIMRLLFVVVYRCRSSSNNSGIVSVISAIWTIIYGCCCYCNLCYFYHYMFYQSSVPQEGRLSERLYPSVRPSARQHFQLRNNNS